MIRGKSEPHRPVNDQNRHGLPQRQAQSALSSIRPPGTASLDLSFCAMADRLYAVAERIVEEGSEVVGVIVRTEAGRAIVLATIC